MTGLSVPSDSRQVVLVTAPSWASSLGTLRRLERDPSGRLVAAGAPVAINLGRNGLGWGRGVSGGQRGADPVKREGDGRSPAGVFDLGTAFGYDPSAPSGSIWPWRSMGPRDRWVDDPASPLYNTLQVAPDAGAAPWTSAEAMRRSDGQYELGVVVRHNDAPPVPGAGSAIFLHVEAAAGHPTSGCTSMPRPAMVTLIRWLDPAARPVLVQAPGTR
jgi:L,D-peptidoglycan transpeptidase YkuD (ErfK/YbiS/YcfS/YnhG family)